MQLTSNGVCPERPKYVLWEYEVLEVFFLNDDVRYFEMEFSPRGRHLVLMLRSERDPVR